ncbi:MAG: FtsX-like permease family protein [Burkholderiaceae bacterium]|nr:FtsX-like permease family protein [Burkholderiaceae bacterium]
MKALLLDALQGLRSRLGATAVAVGGLMLALAVCLLLALLALALAETDPSIPEPDRVVMLDFRGNPPGQPSGWFTASPVSFAAMLKERQVPLDLISRASEEALTVRMQGTLQLVRVRAADPELVALMGLKALHGDLLATLARRDAIAITPALARKLWGDVPLAQVLGRSFDSRGKVYTVTAVIPATDPRSPLGQQDAMVGFELVGRDLVGNIANEEGLKAIYLVNGRVYARLRPGGSTDPIGGWMREAFMANPLYAQLPADWKTGPGGAVREAAYFRAVTLTQLPFEGDDNGLRWQLLGAVGAASAVLLLLAAINTMNLQAASLLQRQRETALRRSLGADGRQLLRLWALEALLPLLLSAAGALLLAWWAAPAVAGWMGLATNHPVADPLPAQALVGLGLAVLVLLPLTLALPAWLALRRAPAPALQGRTASEGPWGRRLRQALLTVQLSGALLLLSLTGVMAVQYHHLLHVDRGFDTHNRLVLSAMVEPGFVPKLDALVAAIGQHPAIRHWGFSSARPARDGQGQTELHVSQTEHKQVLRLTVVSTGFFDTYGMKLLAGSLQTGTGDGRLVIDAKAARSLGFVTPQAAVGAQLRGGGGWLQEGNVLRRVVAVVGDVKQESARDAAMPQAFLLSDEPQWDLTVHGPDLPALRQALEEIWKTHGPPLLKIVATADEQLADAYRLEEKLTTLLAAVSLLAVGVAMLGAYALVADTLRRRRTELVLRRLHGAGHADIARQVVAEFSAPLAVAALLTLPLAGWLGLLYLDGFVDRVGIKAGLAAPLALASALTLLTTALAALRHVRQALALQPIEALA